MERKIGEIFEYNGEWYQCLKSGSCNGCAFFNNNCINDPSLKCSVDDRTDHCSAIFKKLEKVGEPYMDGDKIMQKYKRVYQEPIYFPYKELNCYNDLHGRICIEIKQNKEDMEKKVYLKSEDVDFLRRKFKEITEDYIIQGCDKDKVQREFGKLFSVIEEKHSNSENIRKNFKPFDIEAAKQGKPVCTRDGRKARIICFDKDDKDNMPIVALVYKENESVCIYYEDGRQSHFNETKYDLMMLPEKKEGWVNVRRLKSPGDNDFPYVSTLYPTKEEAITNANLDVIDTIKISWEE